MQWEGVLKTLDHKYFCNYLKLSEVGKCMKCESTHFSLDLTKDIKDLKYHSKQI
jgi:hypothetical protein